MIFSENRIPLFRIMAWFNLGMIFYGKPDSTFPDHALG